MKVHLTLAFLFCFGASIAQIPGTLSYQGILLENDGLTPLTGAHTIEFNFYTASSGGPSLATRTVNVTATKGLYSCVIGDGGAGGAPLTVGLIGSFIGIKVDGGGELAPRAQLTSSAYAFQAQTAYTMDAAGLTGTVDNARLDADLQDLADGSLSGSLVGSGINAANITSGAFPNTIFPAGTPGRLAFWSGANSFGNDNDLFWDNSSAKRLGVGTASPSARLHVLGGLATADDDIYLESIQAISATSSPTVRFRRSRGSLGSYSAVLQGDRLGAVVMTANTVAGSTPTYVDASLIATSAESNFTSTASTQNAAMTFSTISAGTLNERMRISSTGVGIGTTDPEATLDVVGTFRLGDDGSTQIASNGSTLDPNGFSLLRVLSTGAVTLSGTTSIANGQAFGQILVITVTSAAGPITVPDNSNVQLNAAGGFGMTTSDTLTLIWTGSDWHELARSSN